MKNSRCVVEIEMQSGKYKVIAKDTFYSPKIENVFNNAIKKINCFKKEIRSINIGYSNDFQGTILAFAWVNKSQLD